MGDHINSVTGQGTPDPKPAGGASDSRHQPPDFAERVEIFQAMMTGSSQNTKPLTPLDERGSQARQNGSMSGQGKTNFAERVFQAMMTGAPQTAEQLALLDARGSQAGQNWSMSGQGETNFKPASSASDSRNEPTEFAERMQLDRAVMTGLPLSEDQLAEVEARGSHSGQSGVDEMRRRGVDVSEMLAMQRTIELAFPAPVQAPPAAVPPDLTIAELMDKHVKRTLATQGISAARGGEVRLELSDEVLPGTSLSLKQTEDGWLLSATADNQQSRDKLNEAAPELIKRFSQASLGRLDISVEGETAGP